VDAGRDRDACVGGESYEEEAVKSTSMLCGILLFFWYRLFFAFLF